MCNQQNLARLPYFTKNVTSYRFRVLKHSTKVLFYHIEETVLFYHMIKVTDVNFSKLDERQGN